MVDEFELIYYSCVRRHDTLSCYDDKRFVLEDGISTLAYGLVQVDFFGLDKALICFIKAFGFGLSVKSSRHLSCITQSLVEVFLDLDLVVCC